MFQRDLASKILLWSQQFPVVTVVGPRQSGKSTLCRYLFPDHIFLNLEDPRLREQAAMDPRGLLNHPSRKFLIDEIQRVPDLLSVIQTMVDDPAQKAQFVLTGSNHLLLMNQISQTLSGRSAIAQLLPFSWKEIKNGIETKAKTVEEVVFTGGYPAIFDRSLSATDWHAVYAATYVERDVRDLIALTDLSLFQKFLGLLAGRVGSLVNLSSLGNEVGVTQPTIKKWLSLLEVTFVAFTLKPHHQNFSKRLIKTPKVYFYDTGLLCYLLRIYDAEILKQHPLRGFIFENWCVVELLKSRLNQGFPAPFYFWRDVQGHEVDLVIEEALRLRLIEIKATQTFQSSLLGGLKFLQEKQKILPSKPSDALIYSGDESYLFQDFLVTSWREIDTL